VIARKIVESGDRPLASVAEVDVWTCVGRTSASTSRAVVAIVFNGDRIWINVVLCTVFKYRSSPCAWKKLINSLDSLRCRSVMMEEVVLVQKIYISKRTACIVSM
jgi:hypothetical protein